LNLRYSRSCFPLDLPAREEQLALDLHQRGGDDEELAGQFDVDQLDDSEVVEELFGDAGDGDVEQVDLVPLDQVEQEVQGAVKLR
jgi:hypothetical protein